MIARVHADGGRLKYVALHLDPGEHSKRVWVPITPNAAQGDDSLLIALMLCVLTLQTTVGALIADARLLCSLVASRLTEDKQDTELQPMAQHIADTLERVGENLLRLIEQPTVGDDVTLDTEYIIAEPTNTIFESGESPVRDDGDGRRTALQSLLGQPLDQDITDAEFTITPHQIRAGRVLAGLTTRELAERAQLSTTATSQLLTGKTTTPHRKTLKSLESALRDGGVDFGRDGWTRHQCDQTGEHDESITAALKQHAALSAAIVLSHELVLVLNAGKS